MTRGGAKRHAWRDSTGSVRRTAGTHRRGRARGRTHGRTDGGTVHRIGTFFLRGSPCSRGSGGGRRRIRCARSRRGEFEFGVHRFVQGLIPLEEGVGEEVRACGGGRGRASGCGEGGGLGLPWWGVRRISRGGVTREPKAYREGGGVWKEHVSRAGRARGEARGGVGAGMARGGGRNGIQGPMPETGYYISVRVVIGGVGGYGGVIPHPLLSKEGGGGVGWMFGASRALAWTPVHGNS